MVRSARLSHQACRRIRLQIFTSPSELPLSLHLLQRPILAKPSARRSPENVLAEMRFLYDTYGVREFLISTTTSRSIWGGRAKICRRIVASGMEVAAVSQRHPGDRVDEPLLREPDRRHPFCPSSASSLAVACPAGLFRKGLSLENVARFLSSPPATPSNARFFILGFSRRNRGDPYGRPSATQPDAQELIFPRFCLFPATPYTATELQPRPGARPGFPFGADEAMDLTYPLHTHPGDERYAPCGRLLHPGHVSFTAAARRCAHFLKPVPAPVAEEVPTGRGGSTVVPASSSGWAGSLPPNEAPCWQVTMRARSF